MEQMSIETQELAARYGAAWATHDLDAIMALHTDDTVFHLHGGGEPAFGLVATREAFAAAAAQWPDLRFERRRVYVGDGHFVSEYQMSGSSAGKSFACDGVDVIAVIDGRVARKDTYLDWPAVQRQLDPESIASAAP
jgi:ketosteroid isomerase-like protein